MLRDRAVDRGEVRDQVAGPRGGKEQGPLRPELQRRDWRGGRAGLLFAGARWWGVGQRRGGGSSYCYFTVKSVLGPSSRARL